MTKTELEILLNNKLSTRKIARHFGCSQSSVRHWMSKFGLKSELIGSRDSIEGSQVICRTCAKIYIYKRSSGHRRTKCSTCVGAKIGGSNSSEKRRIRSTKRKSQYVEYKGGKCESCGYNKCLKALTFHHVDQSMKEFEISLARSKPWVIVKAELDKCRLLCFNCHTEEHERLGTTGLRY